MLNAGLKSADCADCRRKEVRAMSAKVAKENTSPPLRTSRDIICAISQICGRSINQNENGCLLRRLHHILKRLILRVRLLEFCGHVWHRFEEAQEQAALHRVIHLVAVRKDSGSDPAAASAADAHGGRAPAPWPPRCPPRSRARPPAPRPNCPAAPAG